MHSNLIGCLKMSFRIDDILRKDDAVCSSTEQCRSCDDGDTDGLSCAADGSSILQQTLLNLSRNHPDAFYYKNTNEQIGANAYFGSCWPDWYNCEKAYANPYINKESFYSTLYTRSRLWSMYPSPLPITVPFHYAHYSKRKGGQVRFTAGQTDALEKRFGSHKYLSPEDRRNLAESLKLTDRQVKTWFQNRRAKWRRCNSGSSNVSSENHDDSSDPEPDACDSSSPPYKPPTSTTQP